MRGCRNSLYSEEGVVQGDPLSMFVNATATLPLIEQLKDENKYTQIWYADDSSAIGNIDNIHGWIEKLLRIGPYYGYFPEPTKSSLVVKESMMTQAKSSFDELGINVVTSHRFLGGVIGDLIGKGDTKVSDWCRYVKLLSDMASDQPQASYVALTKSLQLEWSFLQHFTPHCSHLFKSLEDSLFTCFIPSLLQSHP